MAKFKIPIDGITIEITEAQRDAALNWCDRTASTPGRPEYIIDVFPERTNWANGQRRCCTNLVQSGVLRGDGRNRFVMPNEVREFLERTRYD